MLSSPISLVTRSILWLFCSASPRPPGLGGLSCDLLSPLRGQLCGPSLSTLSAEAHSIRILAACHTPSIPGGKQAPSRLLTVYLRPSIICLRLSTDRGCSGVGSRGVAS